MGSGLRCSVRDPPGSICQGCSRFVPSKGSTPFPPPKKPKFVFRKDLSLGGVAKFVQALKLESNSSKCRG